MSSTETATTLRIGLGGLGTVGAGLVDLLARNRELIALRAGRPIEIVAVSARDRQRDRGVSIAGLRWYASATDLAADPEIDLIVELIGGEEGTARALVTAALERGLPVVTANKALLARHGAALAELATARGVALAFEASVAGGIPVIKALCEGLTGILNGTCNFILSQMRATRRPFAGVLAEAQARGYAEADPTLDIDGHDTAHKLAILAALAFGVAPDLDAVYVEGIRHVGPLDVEYAEDLGYRIKLVGTAARGPHGIEQRVHPTMVPSASPLALVEGADNAVVIEGDAVGRLVLRGRGAGAGPTASAVMADIIDIARGRRGPVFAAAPGLPAASSPPAANGPMGEHDGPCYVRFMVADQPGVIADIAAALRDEKVSVETLIQRRHLPGEPVPVVLTTHPAQELRLTRALRQIATLASVAEPPRMIRIEP